MKKLAAILLIPCMLFLVGCSNDKATNDATGDNAPVEENLQNPPELTLVVGNGSEKATIQKYDWTYNESDNNEKNEIKTVMDEQDVVKSVPAVTVSSAQKVSLDFSVKPESYTVKMILPNNEDIKVNENTMEIPIPSSLGKCTFKVEGKWAQGTVTYMFNLDIQG